MRAANSTCCHLQWVNYGLKDAFQGGWQVKATISEESVLINVSDPLR